MEPSGPPIGIVVIGFLIVANLLIWLLVGVVVGVEILWRAV